MRVLKFPGKIDIWASGPPPAGVLIWAAEPPSPARAAMPRGTRARDDCTFAIICAGTPAPPLPLTEGPNYRPETTKTPMLSLKTLTDVSLWARSNGLEIVLLVTGAVLLTRLATWVLGKVTARIDANAQDTDTLLRSEASKHRHALAQVVTWAFLVIVYCATVVAVATRIGIPITSLV